MCTGFEWLMAGASAISAASQITQGQQARRMGDWQAAQATADAQAEREAGIVRAAQIRKQGARDRSAATAALAGSGVDVGGAGTPVVIDQAIVRNNEEDALTQILYGDRRGERLDQDAEFARLTGRNRQTAGYLGGVGSLLAGGAQIGRNWRLSGTQAPAPVTDAIPSGGAIRIR